MSTTTVPTPQRRSSMLWVGLLIVVLGVATNFLYWLPMPQNIIPWISLAVPIIGLVLVVVGLLQSWPGAKVWRKILSSVVGLVSVAVVALSVWGHVHARDVPRSTGAPQVGQKVPDFTLPDSTGQPVSLSQMLANPMATSTRPKALLLVFYRGYW